jgi:hypothetical protein
MGIVCRLADRVKLRIGMEIDSDIITPHQLAAIVVEDDDETEMLARPLLL